MNHIPDKGIFCVDEDTLDTLNDRVRDWGVNYILADRPKHKLVTASVSRLVVDVERFLDDSKEEMSKLGMGVIYTQVDGIKIRDDISEAERNKLITDYYIPYHKEVEERTDELLDTFGKAILIDCHSFRGDTNYTKYKTNEFPQICIGTDDYHTPDDLIDLVCSVFKSEGYHVKLNVPFSGCMIPMKYYNKDSRVHGIMIEVNRDMIMPSSQLDMVEISKLRRAMNMLELKVEKYYCS